MIGRRGFLLGASAALAAPTLPPIEPARPEPGDLLIYTGEGRGLARLQEKRGSPPYVWGGIADAIGTATHCAINGGPMIPLQCAPLLPGFGVEVRLCLT